MYGHKVYLYFIPSVTKGQKNSSFFLLLFWDNLTFKRSLLWKSVYSFPYALSDVCLINLLLLNWIQFLVYNWKMCQFGPNWFLSSTLWLHLIVRFQAQAFSIWICFVILSVYFFEWQTFSMFLNVKFFFSSTLKNLVEKGLFL